MKHRISGSECLCIFGRRGSGKTTLLRTLAGAVPAGQTLIYFDIHGEYGDLCTVRVKGSKEFARDWEKLLGAGGARIQFLPDDDEPEDEELVALARIVSTLRSTTLICDEADVYLAADRSKALQPLRRMVRLGRHQATALWTVGRRPADVDKLITSQSRMLAARPVEPRDLAYFQARYGQGILWGTLDAWEFYLFDDDGPAAKLRVEDGAIRVRPAQRRFPKSEV